MTWAIWAFILVAQNASTTWASRARNSASVPYHSLASSFSNGVWIVSNLFLVGSVLEAARSANFWPAVQLVIFYTFFTTLGASLMHWFSMRFLETGRRRVGAA